MTSTTAQRRILKELQDISKDPSPEITAGPVNPNDPFKW